MEILVEFVLGFVLEIIGPAFFEVLAELVIRSIGSALGFSKPRSPYLSLLGYVLLAAIGAIGSIVFVKKSLIEHQTLRILNLLVTPVLLGWLMQRRGKSLESKGLEPIRLDQFWHGFVFAMTFALIRFFYTK